MRYRPPNACSWCRLPLRPDAEHQPTTVRGECIQTTRCGPRIIDVRRVGCSVQASEAA